MLHKYLRSDVLSFKKTENAPYQLRLPQREWKRLTWYRVTLREVVRGLLSIAKRAAHYPKTDLCPPIMLMKLQNLRQDTFSRKVIMIITCVLSSSIWIMRQQSRPLSHRMMKTHSRATNRVILCWMS